MGKLKDTHLKNAKPHKNGKERLLSDGDGLFLRVRYSTTGKGIIKSWVYRYRRPSDEKGAKITLGKYSEHGMSLDGARADAAECRKALEKGKDPKHTRAAEKAKESAVLTMGQLFDAWFKFYATPSKKEKPKSPATINGHKWRWDRHLSKYLKDIRLPDLTRAHLSTALDAMRKHSRVQTAKAITTLRMMLDYAVVRHMIDENPARLFRPKDFNATASPPRERNLSLDELRVFWKVLNGGGLAPSLAYAFKFLILTGARREEVAGLPRREIDLSSRLWRLPAERAKNGREQIFYLSDFAVNLIEDVYQLYGNSEWVFESDRPGKDRSKPIHKDSLTTALERLQGRSTIEARNQRASKELKALEPFTVHDLRRTAATCWAEHLKVAPHVIERMLNHQPQNQLIATYQRASYAEEQAASWKAWGAYVQQFIANDPKNVIPGKFGAVAEKS